jgi:hypothetical protein
LYRRQWSVGIDARDLNVAYMARLGFIGWGGGRFLVFPSNAAEMVFATTSVAFLTFCYANFLLFGSV